MHFEEVAAVPIREPLEFMFEACRYVYKRNLNPTGSQRFIARLGSAIISLFPVPCTPHYPRLALFMYAKCMLDEKDFQRRADAAFEDLKRRMLTAGDEHGFDVEGEAGKLEVLFEEPEEAKFVISPNTPVREIWVSALSTSFKLGWNESRNAFVLEKTGEDLRAVMSRVISQQLGTQVTL
jgi:iron donor protein CyaY